MDTNEAQDHTCLQAWRVFAGLTQDQLGQMVGVTGAQISRVETGKRDYDGRYLNKIKAAINQTLANDGETFVRVTHVGDLLQNPPNYWLMRPGMRELWDQTMLLTEDKLADQPVNDKSVDLPLVERKRA